MYGYKAYQVQIVLLTVFIMGGFAVAAETWTLEDQQQWQQVSESPRSKYLLAVSKLKELINQGKIDELGPAIAELKNEFPEVAGPDLNEFLEAEKLYAQGNFVKAIRAYDAFLSRYPESPLYDAVLDREMAIAKAYLSGHKKVVLKFIKLNGHSEGVKIADKIIERAGNSPIAVRASLAVAESYEKRGKYEDAYERWSQISSRWPTGEIGKNALLSMARCKHAAYSGPRYDASDLVSAKSYYENFLKRYPEEAKKYEIEKRIEQIIEQQAYKEYTIAEYYQRTGSEEAAEIYGEMVTNRWPQSTAAKRVEAMPVMDEPSQNEQEEK